MSSQKAKHLNDYPQLPYHIVAELGEGGYGRVFRARDRITGNTVALKTLHGSLTPHTPKYRSQALFLEHEFGVCRQIQHPHIVRSHQFGYTETEMPYAVFTYLPGETLHRRLLRLGPLTGVAMQQLMGQALEGLKALHAQGYVHRDIKPLNIMVEEPPKASKLTLIDLGISTAMGSSRLGYGLPQQQTMPQGSVHYCSQAQWSGAEAAAYHDWYAWGLVVLECLTGTPVFGGLSLSQVVRKKEAGILLPTALAGHPLGELLIAVFGGGSDWKDTPALHHDWQLLDLTTLPYLGTPEEKSPGEDTLLPTMKKTHGGP
ncbi:MAG TPA: hypothetical protein DCE41_16915 [Cytophagales bacterium]|nr:hypothetical protein [Cytophagales bacterium]HAA20746.1 hypothetical protein [Cytophagales bacterium]HAP60908.1 hypothetical protein [Cytophagales bacterium]